MAWTLGGTYVVNVPNMTQSALPMLRGGARPRNLDATESARVYLHHDIGSIAHGEHNGGTIVPANASMMGWARTALLEMR